MVYSQIWLNLRRDDRLFSTCLLWMIATLAKNTKFPIKTTLAGACGSFVVVDALVVASSRSGAHGLGPFVAAAMHKFPSGFVPFLRSGLRGIPRDSRSLAQE